MNTFTFCTKDFHRYQKQRLYYGVQGNDYDKLLGGLQKVNHVKKL